ncbi:hypothetical protein ACFL2B_02000 [Patescibacteria group bacterium]
MRKLLSRYKALFIVAAAVVFWLGFTFFANAASPVLGTIYASSAQYGHAHTYQSSGIDPTIGGTTTIHINGYVTDTDGVSDTSGWTIRGTFYRSSISGASGCSADNNNCYVIANGTCATRVVNSTTLEYDCPVAVEYYADATDTGSAYASDTWNPWMYASDGTGGFDMDFKVAGVKPEYNTKLGLSIPDTINYGNLANNTSTTSANNQVQTITQQGNDVADVEVSGLDLTCTSGTIPIGNTQWSLTDVGYNGTGTTALTSSSTDTNLNVGLQTNGLITKNLYWDILIPYDVYGTCSGNTTITAVAH